MSTVKISELPNLPSISANTSNTLFLGVDIPTGVTGKFTAATLAQQLYANNYLVVGDYVVTFPNVVAMFAGTSNNYVQTIIENVSNKGTSDVIAQANVSTDTTYYIDMGFAGSTYDNSSPYNSLGTALNALDGYLYVQGNSGQLGGNLIIGTTVTGTRINFISGGVDQQNIVAYIDSSGIHSQTITSPTTYANGAFIEANAAFLKANSAYGSQNTTGIYANSAFLAANTPSNVANSSSVYANGAFTQANSAFTKANNALANTTGTFNGSLTFTGSISTGNVTINNGVSVNDGGLFQYTTANNSTVTQLTSKSTAVTCNGRTGQITTSNASLAKGAAVSFTVNNSQVATNKDVIIVNLASGGSPSSYTVSVDSVAAGSFSISILNSGAGALAETLVINYAILRVQ